MATYNLGQVAIVSKGAWTTGTAYALLNAVSNNGGSFLAIAPSNSIEPGVTSGWESYWAVMSNGIKAIDIVGDDSSTAHSEITLSDGTVVTGSTFSTLGLIDGSVTQAKLANNSVGTAQIINGNVTTAKLDNGAVTAAKQGFIKFGTSVPTTADISDGEIYLKYEA